ncbi:DUF1592 domain-containing protein [Pelagicoccus mobilis]|uniref:DUF1592 domain-containing protein n=1 Tax=Pelagicoccus mobilis TaxID=415221 RepID=A0A934S1G3_9BACT|nr:DUF1592 domain-containing protein [Pelagicoccus mobilis]MBK1878127.1 DUF1592 domain-containing protein [Pelagicoccus mobilis]
MLRTIIPALGISIVTLAYADLPAEEELPAEIHDFLDLNCYECHNEVDKKGNLDLESLSFIPSDPVSMKKWSFIHDRVRNQEMPPKDEFVIEQDERHDFLKTFEESLHLSSKKQIDSHGRVRSRRLNRIEYENTLHDVLGVDIPILNLLPEDAEQHGFSNQAEVQSVSYHLLEKFMEVNDLCLDEAFARARAPLPQYSRTFPASELSVGPERNGNNRQAFFIDDHSVAFPTSYAFHGKMDATEVPESGWYRITIRAKAFNPSDERPIWTQVESGFCRARAPTMYWIGKFAAREEPQNFTFDAWLEKGHMLSVRPGDRTIEWSSTQILRELDLPTNIFHRDDKPGVAVEWVHMERVSLGLDQAALQQRLFGDLELRKGQLRGKTPLKDIKELVSKFAERAFRRPASDEQLEPYLQFAAEEYATSKSIAAALRAGYRSILSSPRFLYFVEAPGTLDDFNIASRLSYFLWSSPPDQELMQEAKAGNLSNPKKLAQQVDRMLDDPRAKEFSKNFTDSWLDLKEIDFTTPDRRMYPEFDSILKDSMLGETRAFLSKMVEEDLSVTNVIDSEFAMLDDRIARHYGIKGIETDDYEEVVLSPKFHRGGILTQASILKVTANGTTTSPVIRGVWLLERILGEHIAPAPDNAGSVEPDIRGAVSIRDQLDKHRSSASCMSCHQKIDPPGFALENYDVIGGWRKNYRGLNEKKNRIIGPRVDPSYDLPDGGFIKDITDFKAHALKRPEKIAHNLANKLLTYATGSEIQFADRREIAQIVEQAETNDYGFRSLIHACVQSSIFQSK